MENPKNKEKSGNDLFSKTLSEKIKFIKSFEDQEKSKSLTDDNDKKLINHENGSKTQTKINIYTTNNDEMQSTIGKKYADYFLNSSTSYPPPKNFQSCNKNSEFNTNEKSDFFTFIKKYEDPKMKDSISCENIGLLFRELGIFIENSQKNETKECDLLFNLCGVLNLPLTNQEFLSLTMFFQVLQILYQDKLQINRSSQLIQILMENRLKQYSFFEDFNLLREEKGFWSAEKIIIEFRKLKNESETENLKQCKNVKNTEKIKNFLKNENIEDNDTVTIEKQENLQKPLKNYKNRHEMLFDHAKYLKEKQEMNNALKYIEDLSKFSFKPQIIKKPPKKVMKNESSLEKSKSKDPIKSIKIQNNDVWMDECFNRLFVNSKKKQERTEKYNELNKIHQLETNSCTFKPTINNYNKTYSSNNDNNNVKGFDENIKRITEARVEKEKVLKLYEEPLSRFQNNRKYIENRETNYTVPKPFNFKFSEKNDLLLFVDVEVGHGKIGRVGIHHGDNMDEIAKSFAKVYTLSQEMEKKLVNNLKMQIENYYKNLNLV